MMETVGQLTVGHYGFVPVTTDLSASSQIRYRGLFSEEASTKAYIDLQLDHTYPLITTEDVLVGCGIDDRVVRIKSSLRCKLWRNEALVITGTIAVPDGMQVQSEYVDFMDSPAELEFTVINLTESPVCIRKGVHIADVKCVKGLWADQDQPTIAGEGNILLNCVNCGRDFMTSPSRLEKGAKYCSTKCMSEYVKGSVPNTKCAVCGKEYYLKPSHKDKVKISTCSYACASKLRKVTFAGDLNHQYGLRGELNASHRRDVFISHYGYVQVRDLTHPFAQSGSRVMLHRVVMEEHLRVTDPSSPYLVKVDGFIEKYLDPKLVVHHKNKNRLDNRIANLEVMDKGEHISHHITEFGHGWAQDEEGNYYRISGRLFNNANALNNLIKNNIQDAGLDVKSSESVIVPAKGKSVVSTGLNIKVPDFHVGLLWSRSGLSAKHGIQVGAGCIDATYTGELKVVLYNHSEVDYQVNTGDRIAQLLTIPINIHDYTKVDSLLPTERGESGFGSTGQ